MQSKSSFASALKIIFLSSFALGFIAWFLAPELRPLARIAFFLIQVFVTASVATWAYFDWKERKFWRERRQAFKEIKKQLERK